MIVTEEIENKEIAKQYKELLSVSYQTLSKNDKKQIRTAFDMLLMLTEIKEEKLEKLIFFTHLLWQE